MVSAMAEHILRREQIIRLPRSEVFKFFADAGNLEQITPPQLGFHIITPQPLDIKEGALIDYTLRLRGFGVRWRTVISTWDPPREFIDEQLKGPYQQWIHRHSFTEIDQNTTLMEDEVRYRLPFEPLGDAVHFLVRRELEQIFDYRRDTVEKIFERRAEDQTGHSPEYE